MIKVYTFSNNGMVMVCDESGEQMPEYQGHLVDVEARIRRDFPDADWKEPFDFRAAVDLYGDPEDMAMAEGIVRRRDWRVQMEDAAAEALSIRQRLDSERDPHTRQELLDRQRAAIARMKNFKTLFDDLIRAPE